MLHTITGDGSFSPFNTYVMPTMFGVVQHFIANIHMATTLNCRSGDM
jgi:hypothetical protein